MYSLRDPLFSTVILHLHLYFFAYVTISRRTGKPTDQTADEHVAVARSGEGPRTKSLEEAEGGGPCPGYLKQSDRLMRLNNTCYKYKQKTCSSQVRSHNFVFWFHVAFFSIPKVHRIFVRRPTATTQVIFRQLSFTFHRGRSGRGSRLRLRQSNSLGLHLRPSLIPLAHQARDHATCRVILTEKAGVRVNQIPATTSRGERGVG